MFFLSLSIKFFLENSVIYRSKSIFDADMDIIEKTQKIGIHESISQLQSPLSTMTYGTVRLFFVLRNAVEKFRQLENVQVYF